MLLVLKIESKGLGLWGIFYYMTKDNLGESNMQYRVAQIYFTLFF